MSKNNNLVRVCMEDSSMDHRWKEVRKQSKNAVNLANIS